MIVRGTSRGLWKIRGPPLKPPHLLARPLGPHLPQGRPHMSFAWFSRLFGATSPSENSTSVRPDLLEEARALAKAGQSEKASEAYWKIKRKHRTVPGLVEHAELLIELGDDFGAAEMSNYALELEPDNGRANAVRARLQKADDKQTAKREG